MPQRDVADWHTGLALSRQALFWRRDFEQSLLPEDQDVFPDPDQAVALLAWLIWDAGLDDRQGFPGVNFDRAPDALPDGIDPYHRALLEPLVGRPLKAGSADALRLAAEAAGLRTRWVNKVAASDAASIDLDAGTPRIEVAVQDPVTADGEDGPTTVSCPVCGQDQGLVWSWDGNAARVRCTSDDTVWTPTLGGRRVTAVDWEQVTGRPAPGNPEYDAPPPPPAHDDAPNDYAEGMGQLRSLMQASGLGIDDSLSEEIIALQPFGEMVAQQLVIGVHDGDAARIGALLEAVDARAERIPSLDTPWVYRSIATKVAGIDDEAQTTIRQMTSRGQSVAAPLSAAQIKAKAAELLAGAPSPAWSHARDVNAAIDTVQDLSLLAGFTGPVPASLPTQGPASDITIEQAHAELVVVAARAAARLDGAGVVQAMLYSLAKSARRAAHACGALPRSAPIEVTEKQAVKHLYSIYGSGYVDLIPSSKEQRSLEEVEMLEYTRRHLVEGTLTDEAFRRGLTSILSDGLERMENLRKARESARAKTGTKSSVPRNQPKRTNRRGRNKGA
jgi:hypothetical protein